MASFETTNAVLEDWRDSVNYTLETYGEDQTVKYTGILQDCMDAMARGQGHFGILMWQVIVSGLNIAKSIIFLGY